MLLFFTIIRSLNYRYLLYSSLLWSLSMNPSICDWKGKHNQSEVRQELETEGHSSYLVLIKWWRWEIFTQLSKSSFLLLPSDFPSHFNHNRLRKEISPGKIAMNLKRKRKISYFGMCRTCKSSTLRWENDGVMDFSSSIKSHFFHNHDSHYDFLICFSRLVR